jgi:hypothetical protein
LALGIQMMQKVYLMYRAESAPEETLELFRQWMDDANELINRSKQAILEQQNAATSNASAAELAQTAPQAVEAPVAEFA